MKKKDIVKLFEKEEVSYDELLELEKRIEIKRDSRLENKLRTAAEAEVGSLLHDHDSLLYDRFATRFGKDIENSEGLKADLSNIRSRPVSNDQPQRPKTTRRNWGLIGLGAMVGFSSVGLGTLYYLGPSAYSSSVYEVAANPDDLSSFSFYCNGKKKVERLYGVQLDSWVHTNKMHYAISDSAGIDLLICNSKDCNDSNAIYFAKNCGIGKVKVSPRWSMDLQLTHESLLEQNVPELCSIQKKEFLSSLPDASRQSIEETLNDFSVEIPYERKWYSYRVVNYTAMNAPFIYKQNGEESALLFYQAAKDLASCMDPERNFDLKFVEETFHTAEIMSNPFSQSDCVSRECLDWKKDQVKHSLKFGERVCDASSLDCTEFARGVAEAAYNGLLLMRERGHDDYDYHKKGRLKLIETIAKKHGFSDEYAPKIASLREL